MTPSGWSGISRPSKPCSRTDSNQLVLNNDTERPWQVKSSLDNWLIVQPIVQAMLRNAQKSRDAILRAAEELFARSGPHQVSLADVATRAGVSRGLPSYFFKNKETLSRTVMERAAVDVRRMVLDPLRASTHRDPGWLLANLIDNYIEYLAAHPRVVRLLQWDALERTAHPPGGVSTNVAAGVLREAVSVLSTKIAGKAVSGVALSDMVLSIVALCLFPFERMHATGADAAFVRHHKRHVKALVSRIIGVRR
jgi:AcrR family transcriptional regulator